MQWPVWPWTFDLMTPIYISEHQPPSFKHWPCRFEVIYQSVLELSWKITMKYMTSVTLNLKDQKSYQIIKSLPTFFLLGILYLWGPFHKQKSLHTVSCNLKTTKHVREAPCQTMDNLCAFWSYGRLYEKTLLCDIFSGNMEATYEQCCFPSLQG